MSKPRIAFACPFLLAALAHAQGGGVLVDIGRAPITPVTPVRIGLMQVRASFRDGAGSTELVQELCNATGQPQEATFLLPLPDGAVADRFTLNVDGKPMPAEVLDSQRARGIYEEIVRQRRDPGLLEYMGQGLLRARVFPVPPNGRVTVTVRYAEVLTEAGGITSWRFPLRAPWTDGVGPERLSLLFEVHSRTPIRNLFSPLPGLDLVRDGELHAKASLELGRGQMPAQDLQVHYGTSAQDFGLHLLTTRSTGDGYFLMLLSGKRDWPEQQGVARAITLVLDTSGSMQGEKMTQARGAARAFLGSLRERDWFNVMPFSTEARPFFPQPVRATRDNLAAALTMVDGLEARGGTNIEEALTKALDAATPDCSKQDPPVTTLLPITVFLTDGLPTVGQVAIDPLLQLAKAKNRQQSRIFVFGVGHDVNTRLLDSLAAETRGDRDYVAPQESIEVKTDALFQKLSGPVMTDLQLQADGIELLAQEPHVLPDLFRTGSLRIVGRYRGDGHKAIRLRGKVAGVVREYVFEASFPACDRQHDWLPALWAQRRIGALLDQIHLHGQQQELVDEVTRLGKEHGIVTPFTSHLIVEEGLQMARYRGVAGGGFVPGDADQARLRRDWSFAGVPTAAAPAADAGTAGAAGGRGAETKPADQPALEALKAKADEQAKAARQNLTASTETGSTAVVRSVQLAELKDGRFAELDRGALQFLHRRVGTRSFHLIDGVWVDGGFRAEMQKTLRQVKAQSDDYFALLRQHPELGQVFALSNRLVVVVDGRAIEIV